ncbi:MAG: type I-U CRISPR-associated protein Csb2 [Gemmataceae bacterium]|nr:type I-U CRISPR-associated protein Csb2 [Gemmata sp.]MDW8196882.1 type I-U CRISPR-associated protein Csb2 [Gemmataceae bacterium]
MSNHLCFTVRFLQPLCHGRGDGDEPEWPPSPLRLFQALVAAAAARWNERHRLTYAVPALKWLEVQPRPAIVAASGTVSSAPYQLYVPDNTADLLVPQFKKGIVDAAVKRTEKIVRPTHLAGDAVHYLYPLPAEGCSHFEVLKAAARSITHLGWGIDMVAADAVLLAARDADQLPGHRWYEVPHGGLPLRVPRSGTLDALMHKHAAFLERMSTDVFRPVPPLTYFEVACYYSPTVGGGAPPRPPLAAFEIQRTLDDRERNPSRSRFRPFHHVHRVASVAGMVRHACASVAEQMGYNRLWIDQHILGHGDDKNGQATTNERLMFLPLPSITPQGVSSIRRVLIVGWAGWNGFADLRRRLNGAELIDERNGQPVAVLAQLATTDPQIQEFLRPHRTWTTVTPVILPGYDDPDRLRRRYQKRLAEGTASAAHQRYLLERLNERLEALLHRAFAQAGWPSAIMAQAVWEYRGVGWYPGLALAREYQLSKINYPRYHVRVTFQQPVGGPLVVGAGRYRGVGLFVRCE